MTPISYIQTDTICKFRYDTAELKEWIRLGNLDGNVGSILISMDFGSGGMKHYASYGTIENPRTKRFRLHMKHASIFGPMPTPEQILHPPTFDEMFPNAGWFIPGSTRSVQYSGTPPVRYKSRARWPVFPPEKPTHIK